jgi:hypothetical protein
VRVGFPRSCVILPEPPGYFRVPHSFRNFLISMIFKISNAHYCRSIVSGLAQNFSLSFGVCLFAHDAENRCTNPTNRFCIDPDI